jgi:hypothetical protein
MKKMEATGEREESNERYTFGIDFNYYIQPTLFTY